MSELLLEDPNVRRKRDRYQKQSALLSKLTRQLGVHDNRAVAASTWSTDAESSAGASGYSSGDDWRSAFSTAAGNEPVGAARHSKPSSEDNGDEGLTSGSSSRRTPTRMPPPPPPQSSSSSRYY
ncbi:hypothetical protein V6N13_033995 [Hibiscus sabdariffa]|uniref:GED domain-containing protein n=1 Tax=Hibiscus sabdariffa TaxID=183260 RepID=A0ABR2F8V6_9ROSI